MRRDLTFTIHFLCCVVVVFFFKLIIYLLELRLKFVNLFVCLFLLFAVLLFFFLVGWLAKAVKGAACLTEHIK